MQSTDSLQQTLMLGKIEGRQEKGTTEDEMVGYHHRLDGHGFGWTLGVGDGQGGRACCGPLDTESDTTEVSNTPTSPSQLLIYPKHLLLPFLIFLK